MDVPLSVAGRDDTVSRNGCPQEHRVHELLAINGVCDSATEIGMLQPSAARIVCSRRALIDPEKVAICGDAKIRNRQATTTRHPSRRGDVHWPQLALRE